MFSTISALVLACAITINAQSVPCSEAKIGVVPTSQGVKIPPVVLDPSQTDWRIDIPPVSGCAVGVSGVHAIMCDPGVAPRGSFNDYNTLTVHRNANPPQGYGTVTVTVYCVV